MFSGCCYLNDGSDIMKIMAAKQVQDAGLAVTLLLLLVFWFTGDVMWVNPAVVVLVLAMVVPRLFVPVALMLTGFNFVMEKVVTKGIIACVFFLIVTPIGLFMRLTGHDPMARGSWKNLGSGSVFIERNQLYKPKDLERMF